MISSLVTILLTLSAPTIERNFKGQASTPEGSPTYAVEQRETWGTRGWVKRDVIGRQQDGRILFRQRITPGNRAAVPNIEMTYERSPKKFSVVWNKDQVELTFVDPSGATIKNTLQEPPTNLVGPGGILAAIREDWTLLRQGTTLRWMMIVPPKADAFAVRLVPGKIETVLGTPALQVTLEADSWLVRMFAPSTQFWIDLKHQSTLRYRGIGAKDGPDGAPMETILEFKPDALPLVPPER